MSCNCQRWSNSWEVRMGGVSRDCLGIHRSHFGYEAVETLVSGSFGGEDVVGSM